jgi:hypothetical protein
MQGAGAYGDVTPLFGWRAAPGGTVAAAFMQRRTGIGASGSAPLRGCSIPMIIGSLTDTDP